MININKKFIVIPIITGIVIIAGVIGGIWWYLSQPEQSIEVIESEDSPFGFHPAGIYNLDYLKKFNKNEFSDAQYIGVKWHRSNIPLWWFIVQPNINKPVYDFKLYDKFYGEVPKGINILANIGIESPIDPKGYIQPNTYLPIDEEKYKTFVKTTVERYDGDGIDDMPYLVNPIKYWQVDNEPTSGPITDFAQLQKITYNAIKEVCPDCKVLIGGSAQAATEGNFAVGKAHLDWFNKFYVPILKELNGKYVDIFDFHWYGDATGNYQSCGEVYNSICLILTEYNFKKIPIWITEMGSYSGAPARDNLLASFSFQTEKQQAMDYLKRFVFSLLLGVEKVFPAFGLIEGFQNTDGYFDHTGIIYDGKGSNDLGLGIKKLAYYTYKLMVEKLEGSDWNNIKTIQESDNVYAYKFTKNSKPIWVVWWDYFDDTGTSKTITLDVGDFDSVIVTEAVPDAESGADLNENDYPNFFNTETKTVNSGKISLTLGESPVFVEGR